MLSTIKSKCFIIPVTLMMLLLSFSSGNALEIPMRHFTSDDGLAQNDVWITHQDHKGYLWFGTYSGVSRFDGNNFVTYDEKNNGLGGNIVKTITSDAQNNLWLGYNGGLARLDGKRFKNYTPKDGLVSGDVLELWASATNEIWVATYQGISCFAEGKFTNYSLEGNELFGENYSLITGTPEGEIFVAVSQGVLFKKRNQKKFKLLPSIDFQVVAVKYSNLDNILYLAAKDKLFSLRDGVLKLVAQSPLEGKLINMSIGSNNTIWLHSETEVWKKTQTGDEVFSSTSLQEPSLTSLFEDREGNLWLSRWGGTSMLINAKIKNISNIPSAKIVTFLQKDSKGNIWVSGESGLAKLDNTGKALLHIQSSYSNFFMLDKDRIFSGSDDGIKIHNTSGKLLQELPGVFYCALKDSRGQVWIGGEKGLYTFSSSGLEKKMDSTSGLGTNTVWKVFEDKTGILWIGTENGLTRLHNGEPQYFGSKEGLSHNSIWDIMEHPAWGLLVGTQSGISIWKDGKFETFPHLKDIPIFLLSVDHMDRLWVGTAGGVYRIDKQKSIDLFLDKSRGLPANFTYSNSVIMGDKNIYCGTYKGISKIALNIKTDKTVEPLLDVNGLKINQKQNSISYLKTPLQYFENNFTFNFNAIYMYLPGNIKYQYYLKGLESNWSPESTVSQAVYTNLSHGDYELHVQALAEDEKKSSVQKLKFTILPPWWHTWWAYCLYGFLSVFFVIAMMILQTKRVERMQKEKFEKQKRLNEQLELQVKERTIELSASLEKVEEANQEITSSLKYAEMIQRSLLPGLDTFKTEIPDSFVIWSPRDIVGGDIIFAEFVKHGLIGAVIDCTGHGVPGAFMSMIASSGLRMIVTEEGCLDPAEILKRLNYFVIKSLQQDTELAQSDDGMDVSLCFCNIKEKTITFAGAKLPLVYIHNGELTLIKGERQSIGYRKSDLNFNYKNHTIAFEEGMSFYMFTDGITDQLGGEKNRIFGSKRLKKLLCDNNDNKFTAQREIIMEAFHSHKGNGERQDDVTLVGFNLDKIMAAGERSHQPAARGQVPGKPDKEE